MSTKKQIQIRFDGEQWRGPSTAPVKITGQTARVFRELVFGKSLSRLDGFVLFEEWPFSSQDVNESYLESFDRVACKARQKLRSVIGDEFPWFLKSQDWWRLNLPPGTELLVEPRHILVAIYDEFQRDPSAGWHAVRSGIDEVGVGAQELAASVLTAARLSIPAPQRADIGPILDSLVGYQKQYMGAIIKVAMLGFRGLGGIELETAMPTLKRWYLQLSRIEDAIRYLDGQLTLQTDGSDKLVEFAALTSQYLQAKRQGAMAAHRSLHDSDEHFSQLCDHEYVCDTQRALTSHYNPRNRDAVGQRRVVVYDLLQELAYPVRPTPALCGSLWRCFDRHWRSEYGIKLIDDLQRLKPALQRRGWDLIIGMLGGFSDKQNAMAVFDEVASTIADTSTPGPIIRSTVVGTEQHGRVEKPVADPETWPLWARYGSAKLDVLATLEDILDRGRVLQIPRKGSDGFDDWKRIAELEILRLFGPASTHFVEFHRALRFADTAYLELGESLSENDSEYCAGLRMALDRIRDMIRETENAGGLLPKS